MSNTPQADAASPHRSMASTRRITPVRGSSESSIYGPVRSRNRSRSRSPEQEGGQEEELLPGQLSPVLSARAAEPYRGQLSTRTPAASAVRDDRDELIQAENGEPDVINVHSVQHVNILVGEVPSAQQVRMEIEEMERGYQARVQHLRNQLHQYESHRNMETHFEIAELQSEHNSAVLAYRHQAEILAEHRIAQERREHDSERIFQNNNHMVEMAAMQSRLERSQRMMEDAVRERQQAQQQDLDEAVIQERERVIAEAQSALQHERLQQDHLIQQMERNRLSQEERLQNAQGIISGLQRTVADQAQMAESVTRAYQQSFLDNERRQALLARDREEQQKQREDEVNQTIAQLIAEIYLRDEAREANASRRQSPHPLRTHFPAQRESHPVSTPNSRFAGGNPMHTNAGGAPHAGDRWRELHAPECRSSSRSAV